MFSQTVEYALRAATVIGSDPERQWKRQELAKITKVPAEYLSKVLQGLAREGLVRSQRGLGGGFSIAKDPGAIRVLDVVNVVEAIRRIHVCPLGLEAHGTKLCPLHRKLDEAFAAVEAAFATTSLADLIKDPSPIRRRPCEFPLKPEKEASR